MAKVSDRRKNLLHTSQPYGCILGEYRKKRENEKIFHGKLFDRISPSRLCGSGCVSASVHSAKSFDHTPNNGGAVILESVIWNEKAKFDYLLSTVNFFMFRKGGRISKRFEADGTLVGLLSLQIINIQTVGKLCKAAIELPYVS